MLLSPVSYTSNHCQAAGISSCDRHNTKIVVSGLSSFSYSFSPQWIWSITIGSCNLFPLVLSLELSPSHFSFLVIEAKAKSFLVLESSNLGFYSYHQYQLCWIQKVVQQNTWFVVYGASVLVMVHMGQKEAVDVQELMKNYLHTNTDIML